jgi:predicted metal-dependent HD superfamily phosphohydrolase
MAAMNLQYSFRLMWKRLGLERTEERPAYREAAIRWHEAHRAHHTFGYLEFLLREFDRIGRDASQQPDLVRLALWFRHAACDPTARTNEQQSADIAGRLLFAGGGERLVPTVRRLILITRHADIPQSLDEEFMADTDLAILGQAPEKFDAAEKNLWFEARQFMTEHEFRRRRVEYLKQFHNVPSIYWTDQFRKRYQKQARFNVARYLQRIKRPRAS